MGLAEKLQLLARLGLVVHMSARNCLVEAGLVLPPPPRPHQARPQVRLSLAPVFGVLAEADLPAPTVSQSGPPRTVPGKAPAPSSAPPPSSSSTRSRLTPLIFLLPLALSLLLNQQRIDQVRDWAAGRFTASDVVVDTAPLVLEGVSCPAVVEPLNVGVDWRPEDDEAYKTLAVERLQGAVRLVRPSLARSPPPRPRPEPPR